jgi:hypothetical protein
VADNSSIAMLSRATALVLALAAPLVSAQSATNIIYKDVAVIGGGASGSYAAYVLREDFNKSVAIIEKENILGGHVNSWTDPDTGIPYDHGVKTFIDSGNAKAFFNRLGIETGTMQMPTLTTEYIDFKTGKVIAFKYPDFGIIAEALDRFRILAEEYEPLIQGPGYFAFPEPENIPEELLIPFGEFVTKHNLENAMPFVYETTGLGIGNMTNELTLFALQAFGASMARSTLGLQGSFVPATFRNQDVYDAVAKKLGRDVIYSSTVIHTKRSDSGVQLTVKNRVTGKTSFIHARRLLISIEPTPENTGVFDLDRNEANVLGKFTYSRLYSGIIDNENLVPNISYFNLPPNAAPNDYLTFPEASFNARIDYMGSGQYFRVTVIGDNHLDANGAKAIVQKDFSKLIEAGIIEGSRFDRVSWVDFQVHGPMHARVTAKEVKKGFFQKLYALQGLRSTWWTGGAWAVNFQTHLWEFDDIIIPQLLEGLD